MCSRIFQKLFKMTKCIYVKNSDEEMTDDEDWGESSNSEPEMITYYPEINEAAFELNWKINNKVNSLENIAEQLQKCLNRISIINFEIYVENIDNDPFGIVRLFGRQE